MKELNTNEFGPERIWIRKVIAELCSDAGSDYIDPKRIIGFVESTIAKATLDGYTDVKARFSYEEQTYDNLSHGFLEIEGYRLETDKEYKQRLKSHITREITARDQFEIKKRYWETKGPFERLQELQEALKKI